MIYIENRIVEQTEVGTEVGVLVRHDEPNLVGCSFLLDFDSAQVQYAARIPNPSLSFSSVTEISPGVLSVQGAGSSQLSPTIFELRFIVNGPSLLEISNLTGSMLDSNNNPIDFFPASQNGSFSIAEESTMQHQILWDDPPPEWGVTETRLWGGAQGDPAPDPAVTTPDVIVPAADPNEAFFDVVANSGVRAYWGQMIGSGGDGQLSGPLTADTALAPGEIPGFRVVVIP